MENEKTENIGRGTRKAMGSIPKYEPNPLSSFKKTIAIVSGKGGVGKSLVSDLLAVYLNRKGHKVALLDADITGPSLPKAFGLGKQKPTGDQSAIYAIKSKEGIATMSSAYLLEKESDPVIWRGPMIAGLLGSFYRETVYGENDFLLIDMPPGTGDIPLTAFQSIPVDGIVVVASPQDLVSLIVEKAVNMAKMMDIPIIGLVENMSYFLCPDCGEKHYIYGEGKAKAAAEEYGIPLLDEIPIMPELAELVDLGKIEGAPDGLLPLTLAAIEGKL